MKPLDRVNRLQDQDPKSATILEVQWGNALLEYDEGGQGWWPLGSLQPINDSDWATFKSVALQSATIAGILGPAYSGAAPQAAGQLPLALAKAEAGQSAEFAVVWAALLQAVPAPPEELAGLVGLAQACNLPQGFVEALDPAPAAGMVRARDADGRFIADDPATPEDEAWVPAE